jgi:Protein of unknown function (DUF3011)
MNGRACSLLLLLALLPAAALAEEVTCESQDGRQNECDLDTRGDVRLVRQLSKAPCREGDTWGVSRNSVWVREGCRGVFAADGRSRHDDDDDGYRGGRDDGRDDGRGRDGRRGDDDDDRRGGGWDRGRDDHGSNLPDSVTCESQDNRQVECGMDTRGDVRLVRQLSRAPCQEGRSWGVSRNAVWVSNGCRGEFARGSGSGGGQVPGGPAPADNGGYENTGGKPPQSAVFACLRGRQGQVLSTSAQRPGWWEIIVRLDDGRYACIVDSNGNVSDFSRLR